jgi:hypothetical protein
MLELFFKTRLLSFKTLTDVINIDTDFIKTATVSFKTEVGLINMHVASFKMQTDAIMAYSDIINFETVSFKMETVLINMQTNSFQAGENDGFRSRNGRLLSFMTKRVGGVKLGRPRRGRKGSP